MTQDRCLVCDRLLPRVREHVDTCGERCFKRLLRAQRVANGDECLYCHGSHPSMECGRRG